MFPELFSFTLLGKIIVVYSYPLMTALALLACAVITILLYSIKGVSAWHSSLYIIAVLIVALVFARASYYCLNPEVYASTCISPWAIRPGRVFMYGGFIGGLFFAALIAPYMVRLPALKALDLITPGLASSAVFAKLGCLLHGCCFGPPALPPLGLPFAEGSRASLYYQQVSLLENGFITYTPTHLTLLPIQLWESVIGLIGLILALLMLRRSYPGGVIFFLYFGLFSLARLGLHYLRIDQPSAAFQSTVPWLYFICAAGCVLTTAILLLKAKKLLHNNSISNIEGVL